MLNIEKEFGEELGEDDAYAIIREAFEATKSTESLKRLLPYYLSNGDDVTAFKNFALIIAAVERVKKNKSNYDEEEMEKIMRTLATKAYEDSKVKKDVQDRPQLKVVSEPSDDSDIVETMGSRDAGNLELLDRELDNIEDAEVRIPSPEEMYRIEMELLGQEYIANMNGRGYVGDNNRVDSEKAEPEEKEVEATPPIEENIGEAPEESSPEELGGGNGSNEETTNTAFSWHDESVNAAIERYAKLLILNEKLKRKLQEKCFIMREKEDIIREFNKVIELIEEAEGLNTYEATVIALNLVSDKIEEIAKEEDNELYRLGRFMRKKWVSLGLVGAGALGAILVPTSTTVGAILLGAYGLGRFVSTYVGVNSLLTLGHRISSYYTFRESKKADAIGAAILYASKKGIEKHIKDIDGEHIHGIARYVEEYSRKFRRIKIQRHIISALAAVGSIALAYNYIPGVKELFGIGKHGAVAKATDVVAGKNVTAHIDLIAHKGEGIWHLSRRALEGHYGKAFTSLDKASQVKLIDALKDSIVANPQNAGLGKDELISRAINKGGPWLKLNASAERLADRNVVSGMLGKYGSFLKKAGKPVKKAANIMASRLGRSSFLAWGYL